VDAIQVQPTVPPPAPTSDLPAAVGRFQVRARLGQGAFGAVYRAYDPQLDREVALKVPLPGTLDTPERVKRFLREARAAAGLRHPHIVPVFDAGGDPPHCYIASAFIEGRTLAHALRDGPMDLRQAARLVRELADALAYAHRQGIVHRDVKPGNVMLDAADETHLMDFGLAHRREGTEKLTQDGALLGTPAFMAPERVAEPAQEPEAASDQYSLGVLLYELLAGRTPFDGPPEVVLFNALHTEPPPPRTHRRDLPRDLETICLKAMAKRPQDRYATCDALADDLRRWLEGEPIRARRTGLVVRTVKWARRRPAQAGMVVFVTACLVLGVGYLVTAANLRESEAQKTLAEERAAGEQALRGAADAAAAREQGLRKEADIARDLAKTEHQRAESLLVLNRVNNAYFQWKETNVTRAEAILAACPEPLRNWEWYYVRRLCHSALLTLRGHTKQVNVVCFSPDGRHLASASDDETVKIWDAATGKEERTLTGHGAVHGVCFSPDSKRLASGGADKTVSVWNTATGKEELTLRGHLDAVNGVCFSRDGKLLASASRDQTVRLWNAVTGKEERSLTGHGSEVSGVCFSPDSQRLASAGFDGTVRVWDARTGKQTLSLKGQSHGDAHGVAFSPDGLRLASAGDDATVKLWDAATGKELKALERRTGLINAICFSPDGQHVASVSDEPTVVICSAATAKEERTITGHTDAVLSVCYSPNGRHLASASKDRTVRVWDLQLDPEARSLRGLAGDDGDICFSPDSKRLVSHGDGPTAKFWDLATGAEEVHTLVGAQEHVTSLAYSPDGLRLAVGGQHTVRLWNPTTWKEEHTLATYELDVSSISFSPDGKLLAAGGKVGQDKSDGQVKLWDAATGQELRTFPRNGSYINSVCFSPDGQYVASAGKSGTVKLWNVRTGTEERSFSWQAELTVIGTVCFSPDGKWLAAIGDHRAIQVWDAATGKEVFALEGHTGELEAVCFSPDSKRLASGGDDGTIKVWDMTTGQEALSLKGHEYQACGVCFSPDGRFLASAGDDGKVLLWDAGPPVSGPAK